MLSHEELITAEDSPCIIMQRITTLWCSPGVLLLLVSVCCDMTQAKAELHQ